MITLPIILGVAVAMAGIGLVAVLSWLVYTSYLNRLERRLAYRKGLYRDLVTGLAQRDRTLLEPQLRELTTLKDFEALEAVLEEQARGATERPGWLLDAYDRLGLVDKYVTRLRSATKWRERAFAAELLGRVGNAHAVPALLETVAATRTEDADVRGNRPPRSGAHRRPARRPAARRGAQALRGVARAAHCRHPDQAWRTRRWTR